MIRLKSRMDRNVMRINLVYEDGSWENVLMILMPPDGDIRANIEFYDTIAKHYIFNIEEDSETDSIVLGVLEGERKVKEVKSEQSEQNIISFSEMKKASKPLK